MHRPEVTPTQGAWDLTKCDLFIAESLGGRDRDGVAGGQQAGEERAESEQRGGGEETPGGKGVLHPVGENRAKKAVNG